MCRWLGYFGGPIRPEALLYEAGHSLVHQSKSSLLYENGLNGDGIGLGWYGERATPGLYHDERPAWSDRNLQELCAQIESPLFLAHIRAGTGTPVQQTNCHPFRHGRWLFVHNGFIAGYEQVHRELLFAVDPRYFTNIRGSTDSELMFHLALTFGLTEDPLRALERMAGFVEETCARHGIDDPLQMTVGLSDGERLYAARYASGPVVNSLFVSSDIASLRQLYPDREQLRSLSDESRAVVSEPLIDLPGAWHEVPPSAALVVQPGADDVVAFRPQAPKVAALGG
jgi:predicted glutamine amidotransferase